MNTVEDHDLIVLGSGKAGKLLAWTLTAEGFRVAVSERKSVGGACPDGACLATRRQP
jgi:pyruvate/2-oxoglutarate dehydrogenase complex dihydrolipoamide dehydrogenase (E3) component